jgi:hypothetical protein
MKLYQINTKGQKVAKVGGCADVIEGAKYALRIVQKAQGMEQKQGAKYLRTLGISKAQPIHFDTFANTRLQKLGTIRLGQFLTDYTPQTLEAILSELK